MNKEQIILITLEGIYLILERQYIDFSTASPEQLKNALVTFLSRAGKTFVEVFENRANVDELIMATQVRRQSVHRARMIIGETSHN